MASGSEQFLGRQLTRQAQALESLIGKMQEVVDSVDSVVPKYANASETFRAEKTINHTSDSAFQLVVPQLSGTIRVKKTNQEMRKATFTINGVDIGTIDGIGQIDLQVKENDMITTKLNGYPSEVNYKFYYDLIAKPDLIV